MSGNLTITPAACRPTFPRLLRGFKAGVAGNSKIIMETTTRILPAYWASYLINNDASGLDAGEQAKIDAWLAVNGLPMPVTCGESHFSWHNDATALGGDVCQFTFLVPSDPFKDSRHSELAAVIMAAQPENQP